MKTKHIILLVILVILIIIGWFVFDFWWPIDDAGSSSTKFQKVRIGNLPLMQWLPLYMAMEKGYFVQDGIEVEKVNFEAPNQIIDALMQGQLDFWSPSTAMGIAGVANAKNPGKIKIFAAAWSTQNLPAANLLVSSGSAWRSLQDLKDKKVGILGGSIQRRTIVRALFAKEGIDIDKDLTVVELAPGLQVQALASKQIDALLALEPMSTIALQKWVAKELVHGPVEQSISDPIYLGGWVVNVLFVQQHPELAQKVLAIFERTIREIASDPDAARQYLKWNTPLADDLIATIALPFFKTCDQLDSRDVESLQTFYDIFTQYNVVPNSIQVMDILYCTK